MYLKVIDCWRIYLEKRNVEFDTWEKKRSVQKTDAYFHKKIYFLEASEKYTYGY